MVQLIRDSLFGQLVHHFSGGELLQYDDQTDSSSSRHYYLPKSSTTTTSNSDSSEKEEHDEENDGDVEAQDARESKKPRLAVVDDIVDWYEPHDPEVESNPQSKSVVANWEWNADCLPCTDAEPPKLDDLDKSFCHV